MTDTTLITGISSTGPQNREEENNLFPVFLKLDNLRLLIVGGGYVGLEKLNAVLQNAPLTSTRIVAIHISDAIRQKADPGAELGSKWEFGSQCRNEIGLAFAAHAPQRSKNWVMTQTLRCAYQFGAGLQERSLAPNQ